MGQDESDRSLDAVASFLRVWAQHPFDLPNREAREIARALENWASHLLLGTSRPGAPADEAPRGKLGARDWPGVRQFIAALRGEEAAFVRQMLADFRQTVHGLVTRVRDAIAEERVLDTRLAAQLELLRAAAAADDVTALRAAATQVTDALGAVLDAHRVRQAAQEAEMSSRLQALGERLQVAEHLAEEDPLTGLVNRRGFDAELNRFRRGWRGSSTSPRRCCSSTSIASSRSTTPSATSAATPSSAPPPTP